MKFIKERFILTKGLLNLWWNGTSTVANAFLLGILFVFLTDYINNSGVRGIFVIIGVVFIVRSFFVAKNIRTQLSVNEVKVDHNED